MYVCSQHVCLQVCQTLSEPSSGLDSLTSRLVQPHITHVSVEAVRHELKLSVGRNEGDGAVVLKARQTDTLVKLDILQLY